MFNIKLNRCRVMFGLILVSSTRTNKEIQLEVLESYFVTSICYLFI